MIPPVFVTEETDTHNARAYLWSLIPKGSLVITQHIFYTIGKISNLKSCLPDPGDKPIYLDLSCSPELLESPHAIGVLNQLKEIAPLACYQIPVLLSHTGATQFCVDAGFDMFEDIIPWRTWDSIEDEQERCDVACKFIVDYIKHGDPIADWERCQHRAISNRQRLVSDDFKKFCTSQFKL
jgi:hypothetical protein